MSIYYFLCLDYIISIIFQLIMIHADLAVIAVRHKVQNYIEQLAHWFDNIFKRQLYAHWLEYYGGWVCC